MSSKKHIHDYSQTPAKISVDPFRDFEGSTAELYIAKFFYIIRSNLKAALIGLTAAAIIIISITLYNVFDADQKEKSIAEYEVLLNKNVISPDTADTEGAFKQLDAYLSKFKDKYSKNRAELKKLEFMQSEKKYTEASRLAASIAGNVSPVYLKAYFTLMSATYLEMAGKNAESLAEYENTVKILTEDSYMKASALYGKGRMLIATGKASEGRDVLKSVLEMPEFKNSEGMEELRKAVAVTLITN
jgi:hypothetical protein